MQYNKEITYLRELAKKQQEYANKPIMKERARLWKLHNQLKGERPMIVMEEGSFLNEILPPLVCENEACKKIEAQLMQNIIAHELFDDDKVVPDTFYVDVGISALFLGVEPKATRAHDNLGFHIEPIIETLEEDMGKLSASVLGFDKDAFQANMDFANEAIGDILPPEKRITIIYGAFRYCKGL